MSSPGHKICFEGTGHKICFEGIFQTYVSVYFTTIDQDRQAKQNIYVLCWSCVAKIAITAAN